MKSSLKPNDKQQQLQELLINSQRKAQTFFQLYSNQQTYKIAMNAFQLLPYNQITKITSAIQELQRLNQFDDENKVKITQCLNYCRNFTNVLSRLQGDKNQRSSNSCCIMICCGMNLACLFGLWQILFITSANDFIQPIHQTNSTDSIETQSFIKPSQTSNFIYMTELAVYFVLKSLSGFWSLAGFLCSTFYICSCVPQYCQSAKFEYQKRRQFKERILRNRRDQQIKQQQKKLK